MLAASGAGWFASPSEAAVAMQGEVEVAVDPDPARVRDYAELLGIYRDLYPALQTTFARLAAYRTRLSG